VGRAQDAISTNTLKIKFDRRESNAYHDPKGNSKSDVNLKLMMCSGAKPEVVNSGNQTSLPRSFQ